jgi:putative ubiquitin-RnfH superfamily antitoxin RatB of RatAB toxin-antitoxin module
MTELLRIDVVFADVGRVLNKRVLIGQGATVADAIRASGIAEDVAGSEIDYGRVGVFGRLVSPATVLRDGDRVELYRPLKIDPKEARRRRAKK